MFPAVVGTHRSAPRQPPHQSPHHCIRFLLQPAVATNSSSCSHLPAMLPTIPRNPLGAAHTGLSNQQSSWPPTSSASGPMLSSLQQPCGRTGTYVMLLLVNLLINLIIISHFLNVGSCYRCAANQPLQEAGCVQLTQADQTCSKSLTTNPTSAPHHLHHSCPWSILFDLLIYRSVVLCLAPSIHCMYLTQQQASMQLVSASQTSDQD
eukprot:TRINITY_DN67135_c2_g2_i10.p1 TRINITY_DN67135_c2_g2~~TRINITY_DN67135_c2_g2_i10.p1  ORF type:complete len:207 (-),score=11.82 TRINITY_DN67135_c2_g2_i10:787-1407(-)